MKRFVYLLFAFAFVVGCAHKRLSPAVGGVESGIASFYDASFRGHRTANGGRYKPQLLTAAHRSLPFGTRVEVRNKANGRTVDVRINDRGPYADGRVIDLSYAAARALGFLKAGVAEVEIRVVKASGD